MSEVEHNFKEGDYVIRVWPSGHETMGIVGRWVNGTIGFRSLETYMKEGGVSKGSVYTFARDRDDSMYDRKATEKEILMFKLK